MKHIKTGLICALITLLVLLAHTTTVFAETKWTLAIYMVGSDLEEHSLASKDFTELLYASCSSEIEIYVCTGGSKEWNFPVIPSDECVVWKIDGGAITKIASLGNRNMGDTGTLKSFIELIPLTSSKKALLFWDHGSGPILGLCNDENFNDRLLLPEIANGLRNGPRWELIGADACSLSCMELARILGDYANYAVLSQETEPSAGWDYIRLVNGLSSACSGADAGALIAETALYSWMEPYEEWPEFAPPYAMTVLDLSKLEAVEESLSVLFCKLEQSALLGGATFQSQLLEQQIAQPGRYTSAIKLDTIDLVSFAQAYQAMYPAEGSLLLNALEEMIIGIFTNTDHLNGLSMYLPYKNMQLYSYAEKMLNQILMPEQHSYTKTFHTQMRCETAAFEEPILLNSEKAGMKISYQLTTEQQEHFSSGSVLVYVRENDDSYSLLSGVGDITPDEDGLLHYTFENRMLWMTSADGSRTIVPLFDLSRDGSVNRARAHAILMAENGLPRNVLLDVAFNENHAQITSILPTDEPHGKSTLQLTDFKQILFSGGSYIPSQDENGHILPFSAWEFSPEMTVAILPIDGLALNFSSFDTNQALFAQFQIKDVFGQTHSSELIELMKAQ